MILKTDYNTKEITDTIKLFNAFPYTTHPEDTCFYTTGISYYDILTVTDVSMRFEYRKNDTSSMSRIFEKNKELNNLSYTTFRESLNDPLHITRRIKMGRLDSTLGALLAAEDIHSEFVYGLRKKGASGFQYISDSTLSTDLYKASFTTDLFTDIPFTAPYELVLYIENKDSIVNRSMIAGLGTSFVIIILLAGTFIYFIYTVLRQKKISEMKTDFINNMTHEFMTPVTNIALALETMEKKKDTSLLKLIDAENDHLRNNINKVLQIAVLEKKNFMLDPSPLNIHNLLERVAKSFSIMLEDKGGDITFKPDAEDPYFVGDETHIINMFYNIVDNAVKYASEDKPLKINISTGNERSMLWVSISDNGQGMTPDVKKMIFEKFYRAPKGAKHDVKGFGLGLSYVKSIADAHDISIKVTSTLNEGTKITMWFKQQS